MNKLVALLVVLVGLVPCQAGAGDSCEQARDSLFFQVDGHLSFINDDPSFSMINTTYGFGLRSGWRFADWGAFVHLERNLWISADLDRDHKAGVLNLGLGVERFYFDSMARSSIALGSSTLLFDALFHRQGTTGIFVDIRPFGFRFEILDMLFISLDPISFSLVAPVLSEPSIVFQQYRLILGVEVIL